MNTPDPSHHPGEGPHRLTYDELEQRVEDLRAQIEDLNNSYDARVREAHSELVEELDDANGQIVSKDEEIERLHITHEEALNEKEARIRRGIAALRRDWDAPRVESMWYDDLDRAGPNIDPEDYKEIWKKAHRQGNMSPYTIHPDLKLWKGPLNRVRHPPHPRYHNGPPFNFAGLPPNVQAEIFMIWLQKPEIIHCISRISSEPGQTPPDPNNTSMFPHVFWWKPQGVPCRIPLAPRPSEVLELLLVCKDWLYIGATCFYSVNTFAFSSLGEKGRFLKGIGLARRQRIQSIDHTQMGSRMRKDYTQMGLRARRDENNARTRPMQMLSSMVRLSHVALHIDEGIEYQRRKYEGGYVKEILIQATRHQENKRMRRSIRTIHGMDYFYALRGVEKFDIFDYSKLGRRQAITDQNALVDLRNQVVIPKRRFEERKAMLSNLKPFLPPTGGWAPSSNVRRVCRYFFLPTPPIEREPLRPRRRNGGPWNGGPGNGGPGNGGPGNGCPGNGSPGADDRGDGHDDGEDDHKGRGDESSGNEHQNGGDPINDSGNASEDHHSDPDPDDDDDNPRFRGTLRRERSDSESRMFVTDCSVLESDDSDDDDSFINFQNDHFAPAPSPSPDSGSSIVKVEGSTLDDPIIVDDDVEMEIKEESVDENMTDIKSDLFTSQESYDDNTTIIKSEELESQEFDDDDTSTTIATGSDVGSAIKSEVVDNDLRTYEMRNVDLSAGFDLAYPIDLTETPREHDMEPELTDLMQDLSTGFDISLEPNDSASNICPRSSDLMLGSASQPEMRTNNQQPIEMSEARNTPSPELRESRISSKRPASAQYASPMRDNKRRCRSN